MKRKQIATLILTFVLISVGCKNFNSDEGKRSAQKLANGQVWIVRKDGSSGTLERGDCTADLAVEVVPLSGDSTGSVSLSIHKSNSQYSKFEELKNGDKVSFEQVSEPTQKECGDGAFVKLKN